MKKLFVLFALVFVAGSSYHFGQQSVVSSSQSQLDLSMANEVWDVISHNYLRVGEVDQERLKYGLARGLVQSLGDQHSVFMDPEEANAFLTSLNGDLEGIGAELKLEDETVIIVNPIPDSPAERAGIRPGDVILKVNGEYLGSVTNLSEVVSKIRGPKGTDVTLTIIHEGEYQSQDITITRDAIHIASVTWREEKINDQSIPVIQLASFTENIGAEFEGVLRDAMATNPEKLVLDLRFNGGGYLEGAIDVLSYFLESGQEVVSIRNQDQEASRNSLTKPISFDGELVVLVNESSASASEIVAGALQDYGKAHILGVTTFGKGSVQEVHGFFDDSIIRLTIAEWLTPKKRSIEKKGIEPDQVLELDFDLFKEGTDNQLRAALEYLAP